MRPSDVLHRATLVVEDAGPDSVWGVIVLLGRMAQCNLGEITSKWLPAVERWENEGAAEKLALRRQWSGDRLHRRVQRLIR